MQCIGYEQRDTINKDIIKNISQQLSTDIIIFIFEKYTEKLVGSPSTTVSTTTSYFMSTISMFLPSTIPGTIVKKSEDLLYEYIAAIFNSLKGLLSKLKENLIYQNIIIFDILSRPLQIILNYLLTELFNKSNYDLITDFFVKEIHKIIENFITFGTNSTTNIMKIIAESRIPYLNTIGTTVQTIVENLIKIVHVYITINTESFLIRLTKEVNNRLALQYKIGIELNQPGFFTNLKNSLDRPAVISNVTPKAYIKNLFILFNYYLGKIFDTKFENNMLPGIYYYNNKNSEILSYNTETDGGYTKKIDSDINILCNNIKIILENNLSEKNISDKNMGKKILQFYYIFYKCEPQQLLYVFYRHLETPQYKKLLEILERGKKDLTMKNIKSYINKDIQLEIIINLIILAHKGLRFGIKFDELHFFPKDGTNFTHIFENAYRIKYEDSGKQKNLYTMEGENLKKQNNDDKNNNIIIIDSQDNTKPYHPLKVNEYIYSHSSIFNVLKPTNLKRDVSKKTEASKFKNINELKEYLKLYYNINYEGYMNREDLVELNKTLSLFILEIIPNSSTKVQYGKSKKSRSKKSRSKKNKSKRSRSKKSKRSKKVPVKRNNYKCHK